MNSFELRGVDDQGLAHLISEGNKSAFDTMYNRYWERLFLYVVKVVRNKDAAEDILQEVFVYLWCNRERIKNIQNIKAYLFSAARFQGIAYFRKQVKEEKLITLLFINDQKIGVALDDLYVAKELSLAIEREIATLPSKMKEVFLLSRRDELSHAEIGARLNISDKTVKKQVSNALKLMRIKLASALLVLLLIFMS